MKGKAVRWINEILGTNWKHRVLKPSTFLIPGIIGCVYDKLCQTNYFVPSLIAGLLAGAVMVHDNIKRYEDTKNKRI